MVVFTKLVTPNFHKLSTQFVTLDNFFAGDIACPTQRSGRIMRHTEPAQGGN